MTPDSPIEWKSSDWRIDADPAATVAVSRAEWERHGARFAQVDDGQGETPGLAVATVQTGLGPMDVGVLDYGEEETYLLIPERDGIAHVRVIALVLQALEAAGALRSASDLTDFARPAAPSLGQRVAELEAVMARHGLTGAAHPPVAESADFVAGVVHGRLGVADRLSPLDQPAPLVDETPAFEYRPVGRMRRGVLPDPRVIEKADVPQPAGEADESRRGTP